MGYAVLHLDKAPGNEAAMTAHIARTKIPTNASPERTCLNEELVEFPEEVADRTEAISYRLEHAGLTRKIGTNQVRVIRVMLTGSHDAMKRIEEEGRLPEWCADNLAWLRETFGTENVVSAVVHRDESTPHIHAAVVPIVTGERRKARTVPSETPGKRHYRPKSAARPRLCADDVMSRVRLKQYQDTYAAAMSKYGLERGIDGSEARHITTQEFYRQTIAQQQDLQENIDALLRLEEQKRKAVEQLKQQERQVRTEYEQTATLQAQKSAELNRTEAELKSVKGELKGARLKNAAAEVGSNIVEGIGAMIGTSRIKRQQQEIDRLNAENAALHEQIGTLNRANREEKVRHEQAEQQLQAKLDRIEHWLPDTQTLLWGIEKALTGQDLAGKHVLVTAGPTQEAMDPVRFLSNHSTGKMGYAIAGRAAMRGAEVTLVSGPTALDTPKSVNRVDIRSARDMYDAVLSRAAQQDFIIKAAAVGDYRPAETADEKLKKGDGELNIRLARNPDILAALGADKRPGQLLCGFAMETQNLLDNAESKLRRKNCDMLVANSLRDKGAGFGTDTNIATLLFADGHREQPSIMSKADLADLILDRLLGMSRR